MTDVTLKQLSEPQKVGLTKRVTFVFAGVVVALFAGASGLWWRFGEAVFAQSIMGAILACF